MPHVMPTWVFTGLYGCDKLRYQTGIQLGYLGRICIIVAHMSRVCQPRSHWNLKLACRGGGMFSQERSFDEVRILLQIKIIYTGDIV